MFPLPDPAGQPRGIAAGPDGNVWFAERGADYLGRITPAGEVTEFPTTSNGAGLEDIVAGGDGRLWFTETLLGRIGALTP